MKRQIVISVIAASLLAFAGVTLAAPAASHRCCRPGCCPGRHGPGCRQGPGKKSSKHSKKKHHKVGGSGCLDRW